MNLSKTPLSLISSFLLVIALSFSAHLRADDKTTLVFSAIPDQDESRLRARFSKVAKYLEEKLEVPVKYVPVKSYAAAVTSFRNNQLQLAWFGMVWRTVRCSSTHTDTWLRSHSTRRGRSGVPHLYHCS